MKPLSIGQVARQAGVGVETVRFYERQGLLQRPQRGSSGYRQYDECIVAVLRFIRRAKTLGFTLHEIKDLLSLRLDPSVNCTDVRSRADAKVADVEAKIASLQRIRKALVQLTSACGDRNQTRGCPILDALNREDE